MSGAGGDAEGGPGPPGAAGDDRGRGAGRGVAGGRTLLLTDAVGQSVRRLTAGAQAGVDVVVRNADDPKAGPPQAIRPSLVAAIAAVPGAGAVAPVVVGEKVTMVGRDGRPIRHRCAPNLILSWPADPTLAAGYTLRQGRPPQRDGEAVLDQATARGGWLAVG